MGDEAYSSRGNRELLRAKVIKTTDHKQWRCLATRYDKLAAVYRGGVVLRAITIWLTT